MEQIEFPQDFSEFLKLLNEHHVTNPYLWGFRGAEIAGLCVSRVDTRLAHD
jgi:hypothetical protein